MGLVGFEHCMQIRSLFSVQVWSRTVRVSCQCSINVRCSVHLYIDQSASCRARIAILVYIRIKRVANANETRVFDGFDVCILNNERGNVVES